MLPKEKMKLVAVKLGQLNDSNKVKFRNVNSNGHALILELCRGCSLWFIHEKGDIFHITLEFTKSAEEKDPYICRDAKKKFLKLFPDAQNFTRKTNAKEGMRINVTDKDIDEWFDMVDNVKRATWF